jgi:CIC family chloride channel protein
MTASACRGDAFANRSYRFLASIFVEMETTATALDTTPRSLTPEPSEQMSVRRTRRWHFARAAIVGFGAGLLAVAFRRALASAESGRGELLTALQRSPRWGWVVLPAIGLALGSLVGWVTQKFAPEAGGSGIPHLKGVLLHLRTLRWKRLIPVKFFGGVAGIGVGLSMGREGPTVQMGAAVAQALASALRAPASDLPQLLSAGAGAGLAAAFNAPLAGLVFVIEELHRELSSRTAAGALIAAVCATVVMQWLSGDAPPFRVHGLEAMPLAALPLAAIVGGLGGLCGDVLNRSLLKAQAIALNQKRIPRWMLPGIAGLLVGIVAWRLPDAIGAGHEVAERVLSGSLQATLGMLALLMATKFVLTTLCYASGAPGGIFAPMLLIGALVGTMLGNTVGLVTPAFAGHTPVLALLGMAGIFVGSVRAPLTGIVLVSEMTEGYQLLFPICISALCAYLVAEALGGTPIYDALLEADLGRHGHGPAHPEPRRVYVGIQTGSSLAGKTIATSGLPGGCLVVGVERAGAHLLPSAGMTLLPGDHISILVPGDAPHAPLQIVNLCTGL